MTDRQRRLYVERLENSKRTILQTGDGGSSVGASRAATPLPEEATEVEEDVKPKKKGAKKKKATSIKLIVPPQPRIITDLKPDMNTSNVLMDLRKAANHPLLFRRLYTDEKIEQMSQDCLKVFEFSKKDPKYICEDMSIMTDFELHRFVSKYSVSALV